jgi:PadR family transcriptional regulator, regulatory protein PadR
MDNEALTSQIKKGLLVLVVLQVIAARKSYAAEILDQLQQGQFATQEGTLYPLLSRLKREGLIEYEWVESTGGPPRKYYVLSQKGEQYRTQMLEYLRITTKEITKIGEIK